MPGFFTKAFIPYSVCFYPILVLAYLLVSIPSFLSPHMVHISWFPSHRSSPLTWFISLGFHPIVPLPSHGSYLLAPIPSFLSPHMVQIFWLPSHRFSPLTWFKSSGSHPIVPLPSHGSYLLAPISRFLPLPWFLSPGSHLLVPLPYHTPFLPAPGSSPLSWFLSPGVTRLQSRTSNSLFSFSYQGSSHVFIYWFYTKL